MSFKYLVAASLLALSMSANADIYIGGEVNSTAVDSNSLEDIVNDFSDRSAGYGAIIGYKFPMPFAVQAKYIAPEELDDQGLSIDADGWLVSGLGFIPLGNAWSIYGEAGYFDFSGDIEIGSEEASQSLSGESGVLFGAGVNWNITGGLNTRLGATLYDVEGASVNQFNLGVLYEF